MKFLLSLLIIFSVLIANTVYIVKKDIEKTKHNRKKIELYQNFNQRINTQDKPTSVKVKHKKINKKLYC